MPHIFYCSTCNQNLVQKYGDDCADCRKRANKQQRDDTTYKRQTTKPITTADVWGVFGKRKAGK